MDLKTDKMGVIIRQKIMTQKTLSNKEEKFIDHKCKNRKCDLYNTDQVHGEETKKCPFCGKDKLVIQK